MLKVGDVVCYKAEYKLHCSNSDIANAYGPITSITDGIHTRACFRQVNGEGVRMFHDSPIEWYELYRHAENRLEDFPMEEQHA